MSRHPYPAPGRTRATAGAIFALLALGLGVLALATPAGAEELTDEIPLEDLEVAPTEGTLDNGVSWEVNVGQWSVGGQGYVVQPGPGGGANVANGPHTVQQWQFDHVVDVEFGISGLNNSFECFELPAGVIPLEIHDNHEYPIEIIEDWDEDEDHPCAQAPADGATEPLRPTTGPSIGVISNCAACVSSFRIEGITSLDLWKYGSGASGPFFMEVTYNTPEAEITGPADGASIPAGSDETLEIACTGGGGTVTPTLTVNGQPFVAGSSLAGLAPGTYDVELTCTDEPGGTSDTVTSTFVIAAQETGETTTTTTAPEELPRTGTDDTTKLGLVGALTIVLGLATVIVAPRAYRPRHLR